MKEKIKRPMPTIEETLAWLEANHPEMAMVAEVDRNWVWLSVDMRGDQNKAAREAIKAYGFRWAKRGHLLPSGGTGTWANACLAPTRFFKRGKSGAGAAQDGTEAVDSDLLAELAAI